MADATNVHWLRRHKLRILLKVPLSVASRRWLQINVAVIPGASGTAWRLVGILNTRLHLNFRVLIHRNRSQRIGARHRTTVQSPLNKTHAPLSYQTLTYSLSMVGIIMYYFACFTQGKCMELLHTVHRTNVYSSLPIELASTSRSRRYMYYPSPAAIARTSFDFRVLRR